MKQNIFLIITLFVLFSGCMSEKAIVRRFYTIEIPPGQLPAAIDQDSVINSSCLLDHVSVSPVYANIKIVNRNDSHEVSYYMYHQWAIRPSEAIISLILEHMESSGIFKSVTAGYTSIITDYRFETFISKLELIEIGRSSSAHLCLEFKVIDCTNDQIILIHKADRTTVLKQKDINLFSREISNIISKELTLFTTMIKDNRSLFTNNAR